TQIVVKRPMAMWFSDEYDPRYRDPKRQPPGVNRVGFCSTRDVEHYTLRVGDLCFAVVGRIVNRGLTPVRYQPTMCLVINSPVQAPALAQAVRRDWAGLTEDGHRRALITDILNTPSPYDQPAALRRLYDYYPREAEPIMLKLLRRPLFDEKV